MYWSYIDHITCRIAACTFSPTTFLEITVCVFLGSTILISIFAPNGSNCSPFYGFPLTRWRPSERGALKLKCWGQYKDTPTPLPPPPGSHNRGLKLKSKMATGSRYYICFTALTRQICTVGVKTMHSDSLCVTEVYHQATHRIPVTIDDVPDVAFSLLKLTSNLRRTLRC